MAGLNVERLRSSGKNEMASAAQDGSSYSRLPAASHGRDTEHISDLRDHSRRDYVRIPPSVSRHAGADPINLEKNSDSSDKHPTKLDALRAWRFEFVALVVSFAALASIVALLQAYHEKVQPKFAGELSINTFIAVFSTVLRATLVYIVAEVIGQFKWLWMKTPRPLRHIEYFDNSSRGAWGSFRLLFVAWKPSLTSLGILIIISSTAIGPFSQQAAKIYPCPIETAGVARVSYANWVSWITTGGPTDLTPELKGIALNALAFGTDQSSSSSLFQCTSGNCTFNSYAGITHSSIGICSQCTDATASLEQSSREGNETVYYFNEKEGFNLTWPPRNNTILQITSNVDNMDLFVKTSVLAFRPAGCSMSPDNSTQVDPDDLTCQQKAFGGKRTGRVGQDVILTAINCTLSPCVRHYNAKVSNGVLQESIISTTTNITEAWHWKGSNLDVSGATILLEPCVIEGIWYDRSNISMVPKDDTWVSWAVLKSDGTNGTVEEAPSECIRTMGMPMVEALGNLASETLAGNCTARSNYIPDKGKGGHLGSGATNEQIIVSCEDRWLLDYLYKDSLMTLESFSAAHESMATAINNRVRRDMSALDGEVSFVEGSVWATEVCVDVDWVWLVYPGVLLILTAGLLVTTYLQCCQNRGKQPIWKSSILSILFYDIRTQGKEDRTGPNGEETPLLHLAELESLADRTMAHFSTDARRPGFVVEQEER